MDFKSFKNYVITNYTGDVLCNCVPGYKKDVLIAINSAGYLKNQKFGDDLSPEAAKKFWQWLFDNKHRVGDIIEVSSIEKRIDSIIGKTITTSQKDVFGNVNEVLLTIKELIPTEDEKYFLSLVDSHGSEAKTPKSFTLAEIEKLK